MRGRRDINKFSWRLSFPAIWLLCRYWLIICIWSRAEYLFAHCQKSLMQILNSLIYTDQMNVEHLWSIMLRSGAHPAHPAYVVADMWSTCLEFMEDPKTAFWACAWETLVSVCVCRHPPLHTNTLNKKGIHFLLILSLSYLGHHILARLSIISLQCPGRGWSEISVCVRCSTVHHVLKYDFNSFSFAMLLLIFFGGEGKHPPHSLRGLDWRSHMSTY